ncbi:formyltransferase family protein [Aliikangiella sp. IMCC44653]
MRITILTNLDLASCIALNELLPLIKAHSISLFYSSQVGSNTEFQQDIAFELQQIHLLEHVIPTKNIFPLVEKEQSRETSSATKKWQTFNQLASDYKCTLQPLNDINQASGQAKLNLSRPDLILSIRFGKILKREAISLAKLGVLNLHSGILPQYQGVMAVFWAMLKGEKNYGTSLHWIDSHQIDAGPIVKISQHPLNLKKSYFENLFSLYAPGAQAIANAVDLLANGHAINAKAQQGQPQYYSFPSSPDFAQFKQLGLCLIDPLYLSTIYRQFG